MQCGYILCLYSSVKTLETFIFQVFHANNLIMPPSSLFYCVNVTGKSFGKANLIVALGHCSLYAEQLS